MGVKSQGTEEIKSVPVSRVDLEHVRGDNGQAETLIKTKDGNPLLGSIPMAEQVKTLHFSLRTETCFSIQSHHWSN